MFLSALGIDSKSELTFDYSNMDSIEKALDNIISTYKSIATQLDFNAIDIKSELQDTIYKSVGERDSKKVALWLT